MNTRSDNDFYLNEHLKERHLQIDRYNGIMITNEESIIFPLWNLSGQMVGYQQYRPNASKDKKNNPREGRYYTSIHGNKYNKQIGMWGLESYHYNNKVLVITEGIFDCCRLHNLNIPAVALLSSSSGFYKNWLTSTGRKIYKVEDSHGSLLGPYENLNIPYYRNDIGDCTSDEIIDSINSSSIKHLL